MSSRTRLLMLLAAGFALLAARAPVFAAPDPTELVKAALHHWRGDSSYTKVTMTIHRPDWQRSMVMAAWTWATPTPWCASRSRRATLETRP